MRRCLYRTKKARTAFGIARVPQGLFGAVLALVLLSGAVLSAQEEHTPQETTRDESRLMVEIEDLQRQIQHEKDTFANESLAFSEKLERLTAQRDGLLLTIESFKEEIAQLARTGARMRRQSQEKKALHKREREFLKQVWDFAQQSTSELTELVDTSLPGSDTQALEGEAAKVYIQDFDSSSLPAQIGPVEMVRKLFDLAGKLLARSRKMDLYSARTLTGAGEEKQARFARIGEITSLYLTQDEGEAGILLRSAAEGDIRLYERSLPGSVQSAIHEMFEAAGSPKPRVVNVPMDVSQDMVVGVSYAEEGVVAFLRRGGPVIVPLLLVAALAAALIVERLLRLRRESSAATKFAGEVLDTYRAKGLQSALALAGGGRGAVARVMRAGLEKVETGGDIVEESLREAALAELPQLERFLSTIAVLATVAPLLGLLGTVTGMISAFDKITAYGTSDPRLLSGGISEALITTMVGLIIAIPVLLMHGFLSAKVDRIITDLEQASSRLAAAVAQKARKQDGAEGDVLV